MIGTSQSSLPVNDLLEFEEEVPHPSKVRLVGVLALPLFLAVCLYQGTA